MTKLQYDRLPNCQKKCLLTELKANIIIWMRLEIYVANIKKNSGYISKRDQHKENETNE